MKKMDACTGLIPLSMQERYRCHLICVYIYCKPIFICDNFISQFIGDKLVCSYLFSQSTCRLSGKYSTRNNLRTG